MKQYTETLIIKITKIQSNSLNILSQHGVNISQFTRAAIAAKINEEWPQIKKPKKMNNCPF
jgi:post-segregation antitoxin (ccd killing protein)